MGKGPSLCELDTSLIVLDNGRRPAISSFHNGKFRFRALWLGYTDVVKNDDPIRLKSSQMFYENMPENPRLLSLGMNGITERSLLWLAKRRPSQA
jgi:hypothetical protein